MLTNHNQDKYHKLRKEYPVFTYEGFHIRKSKDAIRIRFSFVLDKKVKFLPYVSFPMREFYSIQSIPESVLKSFAFNLGMTEMISYWKATCSPKIIIKDFHLDDWQKEWWKKLFYKGLGEFFYINGIVPDYGDLLNFEVQSEKELSAFDTNDKAEIILPVGGGKDSLVSLDILKNENKKIIPFVINPAAVHEKVLGIAGMPRQSWIEVKRMIDPELLKLNEKGYLNGHTPFSAIVAFTSSIGAIFSGNKNIALSNESSANEPSIPDTGINHQYSKSIEFESDFRNYMQKYLSPNLNYFSFLRPLNELQIAKIFANLPHYHHDFRSCNVGSKIGIWCGECPKCLFTYVILSAFLSQEKLSTIFGKNLFEDNNLHETLLQLSGSAVEKPFECVGTIDEVKAALALTIKKYKTKLPHLLRDFKNKNQEQKKLLQDFENLLNNYDPDNFLEDSFENIIMKNIQWKES